MEFHPHNVSVVTQVFVTSICGTYIFFVFLFFFVVFVIFFFFVFEVCFLTIRSDSFRLSLWSDEQFQSKNDGFDHINRNAPVLIRTPKLTRFELAQYWGGGPPGNSVMLNPIFLPGGVEN